MLVRTASSFHFKGVTSESNFEKLNAVTVANTLYMQKHKRFHVFCENDMKLYSQLFSTLLTQNQ